jgi:hypothetical protein
LLSNGSTCTAYAERAALDSRCDRLARELEDAMVKVEVGLCRLNQVEP